MHTHNSIPLRKMILTMSPHVHRPQTNSVPHEFTSVSPLLPSIPMTDCCRDWNVVQKSLRVFPSIETVSVNAGKLLVLLFACHYLCRNSRISRRFLSFVIRGEKTGRGRRARRHCMNNTSKNCLQSFVVHSATIRKRIHFNSMISIHFHRMHDCFI